MVLADQVTGAATVMSPLWLPAEPLPPVETVTLALPSAVCSVVTLMTLLLPEAVKPVWLLSAAVEMVTSYGSSSSVPKRPLTAARSVKPL